MRKNLPVVIFILFLICTAPVYAAKGDSDSLQKGDFGFNFFAGMPFYGEGVFTGNNSTLYRYAGVGFISHLSKSFALEPGFFFNRKNQDDKSNTAGGTNGTDKALYVGTSMGLFYYGNLKNNMYFYTGPRGEYGYYKRDDDSGGRSETRTHDIGISIIFGLKYMLSNNFGLFADIGLGYTYSNRKYKEWNSSGTLTSDSERKTDTVFISKGMLGVVFYL